MLAKCPVNNFHFLLKPASLAAAFVGNRIRLGCTTTGILHLTQLAVLCFVAGLAPVWLAFPGIRSQAVSYFLEVKICENFSTVNGEQCCTALGRVCASLHLPLPYMLCARVGKKCAVYIHLLGSRDQHQCQNGSSWVKCVEILTLTGG